MVKCCCVLGCRNNDKKPFHHLSFFSIPSVVSNHGDDLLRLSKLRRDKWVKATGRPLYEWEPKPHHRICSEHFVSGRPSTLTDVVNVDWSPTLKLKESETETEPARKRPKNKSSAAEIVVPPAKKLKPSDASSEDLAAGPSTSTAIGVLLDDPIARWHDWNETVNHILAFLKTGQLDSSMSSEKQQEIISIAQKFYIEGGTLYRRKAGKTRKVITAEDERDSALSVAHSGEDGTMHNDAQTMTASVKLLYLWKGIKKDVANWINQCRTCNPLDAMDGCQGMEVDYRIPTTVTQQPDVDDDDDVILLNSDEEIMEEEYVTCDTPPPPPIVITPIVTKSRPPKTTPTPSSKSSPETSFRPIRPKLPPLKTPTGSSSKLTSPASSTNKNLPLKVAVSIMPPTGNVKLPGPAKTSFTGKKATILSGASYASLAASSNEKVFSPLSSTRPMEIKKVGPLQSPASSTNSSGLQSSSSSQPKVYRPAAWLLHGIGLRLVREIVYEDLIAIQEEKDTEQQLGEAEQKQLTKLRSAYIDLVQKNDPYTSKTAHVCRCKFVAGLRLELELHRDYGHATFEGDTEGWTYSCCVCGEFSSRSSVLLATHVERVHGRQLRTLNPVPVSFCPYCTFEQRTSAKVKLQRHIERCSLMFRIDLNLAPHSVDGDIPLIDVRPPAPPITSAASSSAILSVATPQSGSGSKVSSVLNTSCTTVSAAGSVMSPGDVQMSTPVIRKVRVRPSLPPDGLGFEICEVCGAFVQNLDSLVVHMATAHKVAIILSKASGERPPMQCDKCTERFWSPLGLAHHMKQMHKETSDPLPPGITICPLCKRTRLTDVVEHLVRAHRISLVDMFAQRYCSVCQLTLHTARSFEQHMTTYHAELFPDRAALYATIVAVDRATRGRAGVVCRGRQPSVLAGETRKSVIDLTDELSCCKICGAEFKNEQLLNEHVQGAHAFACSRCSRRCTTAGFLRLHVLNVHGSDMETCMICAMSVVVSEMSAHLEEHSRGCHVEIYPCEDDLPKRRHGGGSVDSGDFSSDDSVMCLEQSPEKVNI